MRTPLNNPFAVLFLGLGIMTLLAASAAAQMHGFHGGEIAPRGVPASVTSIGFGGHPGPHGVPASVTSLGFGSQPTFRGFRDGGSSHGFGARNGFHERPFEGRHHQHFDGFYSPYYGGYYGYGMYPYPYDLNPDDYTQDDPTAYDRPSPRAYDDHQILDEDYRAGLNPPRDQSSQQNTQNEQSPKPNTEPVVPEPSTVLVFKDGHQQEISNYAIVGNTLYDLSDGRSKKVQLADLNLTATVKENDQRGVEFQLPTATALN
ncbi:MAG: hypothetical protein JWN74_3294 [Acidobacteriaceae bacterium]|nr:hypothetical protein [Acidobacteriaceae bacterium]